MNESGTAIDTSYRHMSVATLWALRAGALKSIEAIHGQGQSFSGNGRQTNHPQLEKLTRQLANCDAALAWHGSVDAPYGPGIAKRFGDFSDQ